MMTIIHKSLLLLLLLCSPLIITNIYAQNEPLKVAVFDPVGEVEGTILQIVREEISSVLVNSKNYTVLERQLINKVLEENKFQGEGMVDESQISEIGKIMGADYVFISMITPLKDNYYLSCKMIEVATARIEKQFTGTTKSGIDDITQSTQYVVKHLLGENITQQTESNTTDKSIKPISSSKKTQQKPSNSKQDVTTAKQKRYIDIGYDFPNGGTGEKGSFEINTSYGFQFNKSLFAGLGVGLHVYNARDSKLRDNMGTNYYPQYVENVVGEKKIPTSSLTYMRAVDLSYMVLPIFLDMRGYYPLKNSAFTPFAMLRVGFGFNLSDGFGAMGMYMTPAVGVKYQVSQKIGVNFSAGYSFQRYGGIPEDGGYGYYYYKDATKLKYEAKGASSLSVKLGVEF